jgi:hypothetical protein
MEQVMKHSEPNMYAAVAAVRNVYVQAQWSRAQIGLIFNTIAFPLIFNPSTDALLRFVISIVGVVLTMVLAIAIKRGSAWLDFYEKKLAQLEQLDCGSENAPRITIFADPIFTSISKRRLASRKIGSFVSFALIAFWFWEAVRHGYATTSLLWATVSNLPSH